MPTSRFAHLVISSRGLTTIIGLVLALISGIGLAQATASRVGPAAASPTRVSVFPIVLNDLSNQPVSPELPARMRRLAHALGERLAANCGYQVVPVDSLSEGSAETAPGYLYAHPDVAVGLAGSPPPEWVIIPRLNRASPWITDLQAHVVRVRDTALVSNRIVEVKGIELGPELAAKLIDRGAAWMADQVSQAIEHSSDEVRPPMRRCPA